MPFILIGKGLLIGLLFGIPAGAIGALTIQRTLEGGFWYGFLTGLGSSAADMLYAVAGIFGITFITGFLQRNEKICSICGAALILLYGIFIIRKKTKDMQTVAGIKGKTYVSGFASAFCIAIMNPSTVLSFLVAFSAFGLIDGYTPFEGALIILGILFGTGIWWGTLSFIVDIGREKVTESIYKKMNLALGIALIGFALLMIIRCF